MHTKSHTKTQAFALFEILLSTVILAGIIYLFLSFLTAEQRTVASKNVGKTMGIVVNDLVRSVATSNDCPATKSNGSSISLNSCMGYNSDDKTGMSTLLKNAGIDPQQSTVKVSPS